MLALVALIQDDGLTVREVLSNIPHDAAAIFVYLLLALFIGFIWWGSRSRPTQNDRETARDDAKDVDDQGVR
ncbi:MAG: hypothetical protein ACREM1_00665 [Longimicrobiales bacterium]